MKVDLLAIAAHPDDLEITSGGLIARMVDRGYQVAMLDMVAGEAGSAGTADQRALEAVCAAKVLGVSERINLGLSDAHLVPDLATRAALAQKIRDLRPEMVILPYWEQRHPDHRVTCRVGYDACFYAGLSKAKLSGEPHRPRKIIYSTYYAADVREQFAVDVSEYFERKLESIRCYRSQFPVDGAPNRIFIPGVDISEYVRLRDRELGIRIRVEFAEGYVQKDLLAVDDPLQLGGVSI